MKSKTVLFVALLSAAWLVVVASRADQPAPLVYELRDQIDGLNQGQTLWVSKERASGTGGIVDWEAIGEHARESYENIRSWPVEAYTHRTALEGNPRQYDPYATGPRPDGVYYGVVHGFGRRNLPSATLRQQLDNAESLIEGEVVAKQVGFTRGIPVVLLTVRVDHFGSAKGLSADGPIANIFWPAAKFTIGEITFEKGNPEYPEIAPDVGNRVLFLSAQFHELANQTALWAEPKRMAYGREGSFVHVPVEWANPTKAKAPWPISRKCSPKRARCVGYRRSKALGISSCVPSDEDAPCSASHGQPRSRVLQHRDRRSRDMRQLDARHDRRQHDSLDRRGWRLERTSHTSDQQMKERVQWSVWLDFSRFQWAWAGDQLHGTAPSGEPEQR